MALSRAITGGVYRSLPFEAFSIQKRQMSGLNLDSAIKDIETRWHLLPEAERGALADALAEKQKGDWKKMSLQEKRASYWMSYGLHGSRNTFDPAYWFRVITRSATIMAACIALGVYLQKEADKKRAEFTPEWQAHQAGYFAEHKINPITLSDLHEKAKAAKKE